MTPSLELKMAFIAGIVFKLLVLFNSFLDYSMTVVIRANRDFWTSRIRRDTLSKIIGRVLACSLKNQITNNTYGGIVVEGTAIFLLLLHCIHPLVAGCESSRSSSFPVLYKIPAKYKEYHLNPINLIDYLYGWQGGGHANKNVKPIAQSMGCAYTCNRSIAFITHSKWDETYFTPSPIRLGGPSLH